MNGQKELWIIIIIGHIKENIMKLTFEKFKQIILESILDEDKSRLIDRLVLPDIENEEEKQKARNEMKAFFKKYNTWENKLNWNKLATITYADFKKIRDQASQTKGAQKREIASGNIQAIFKSVRNRKFEIVGENDNWLFVAPLTYEAAVYCDSSENQGAGAQWCIGYKKDDSYWKNYIKNGSVFIMAFNKNYKSMDKNELETNLKYMIQKRKTGTYVVWNQSDNDSKEISKFNNKISLEQMFDNAKEKLQKEQKVQKERIKIQLKEKIDNLKNIKVINTNYFTKEEKQLIKEIVIPDNIKEIGDEAFSDCKNLTSITIPSSVKYIGEFAFLWCVKLKEIRIPTGVKELHHGVFSNCWDLSEVIIPKSVTKIGDEAFYECNNLINVVFLGRTLTDVKSILYYPWSIKNPRRVITTEK